MYKILIADDEALMRKSLCTLIDWAKLGCQIVGTAENGLQAKQAVLDYQPDIIIADIKMPVMDGLAMIRAAQEQHVDTVFVVLSGYGDYEYTSQAMQLGIRHYILKPCDEAKILPVLEQARAELHERRRAACWGIPRFRRMSACWWMPVCMTNSPRLWSGFVMNLRGFAPGC